MKTVYLKDGTQANLITKTDQGYLVDPYFLIHGYEGEEEIMPSGNLKIVSEVFEKAPIEVIDSQYKEIAKRAEEQRAILKANTEELQNLRNEVYKLQNQKTDLSKYIINRSELRNSKRLIAFEKDKIAPHVLDGSKSYKFTVTYEISQYKGEEKCWIYQLWSENSDRSWSSGNYFDPAYGIMIDLTDEEIKQITFDRQSKKGIKGFNEYVIAGTSDEWLMPEFIAEKKRLKDKQLVEQIERAKGELEQAKKKLASLTKVEVPA